jgi:beta-lactamase class A
MDATFTRRTAITGALALGACQRQKTITVSQTPPLDFKLLNAEIAKLAARVAPGRLGVGLTNLENAQSFVFNGDQPFPLQSVFKLHLAAAVLAEVDAGRMSLEEPFHLTGQQLSPPWSPIAAAWPARDTYSTGELLTAIIDQSDNTAADVLMKRIGGPGAVTAWLRGHDIDDTSIDRYERELQPEAHGMASFRPAWAGETAFTAAREAVPPAQRMAAMQVYLRDRRDTATPRSMIEFLSRLNARELLSETSTAHLLQLLYATPRGATRLKPGFPAGTRFAHKIGTSGLDLGLNLAFNDVGLAVLPDKRSYVVAAFLAGSTLSMEAADALMTDLARLITRAVG